ncbi:MAG: translocation/assembly module TamB domain-containing protein [Rhodanobacter sp.]|jgi:translocation and assembly module TamB|nr:translocation/assembly module TamB domain-containing protein [Rhodanobacter sp.]
MNTADHSPAPEQPRRRSRVGRVLKWMAGTLLVLVLALAAIAFWLLDSESGVRFVLARAVGATDGKLRVERGSGVLLGPLTLEGVRWQDASAGVDVKVARVVVDVKASELFAKRVHVTQLDIDHVDVALTTLPPQPADTTPPSPFSLAAPIDIVLDRLALNQAAIAQDGKPVFALDSLAVAGAWTHTGVTVKTLNLHARDGSVDLTGTVSTLSGYPGDGQVTFRWKCGDITCAGTLDAHGDGTQMKLDLAVDEPTPAKVLATLTQSADLPWTASISVPSLDPRKIQKDLALTQLMLHLQGSGDLHKGALGGQIAVNDHTVQIDAARYALDAQNFRIEALTLKSPEMPGSVNASGVVRLDANPVSATLALDWQSVEIPADLAGQALATHGKLQASGSAQQFHTDGTLSIGPPGKLADLAFDLGGTPDAIDLKRIELKQAQGGLGVQGHVRLKPALGWQLTANANKLDPGAFAAQWPGALDFALATDGTLTDHGPDATLKLDKLGGTLRQRPVSGNADIKIAPGMVIDGTLALASGKSRVEIAGHGGTDKSDATLKLAIASLGDWLPDAAGSVTGEFRMQGQWPKLAIDGNVRGARIAAGTTHLDALDISANIASVQPPQGRFDVKAHKLASGDLLLDTIDLAASGNQQAHELTLDAKGTPLGARLALSGSAKDDGRWNGTLKTLDLAIKDQPPLALEQAAQMNWNGQRFSATDICLTGGGPKLCVAGNGDSDGAFAAQYRIERLPLALIVKLAAPDAPLKAQGMIAGRGDIRRAANGALSGNASIDSDKGSVAYPDTANQPLLAYSGFALNATLAPQSVRATLHTALDHDGKLDGEVTLNGAPGTTQALTGHVNLTLNSLAFVELLTPEVANIQGRIAADYTLGGTTSAPRINGALTLKSFATELPSAGLKLHDGDISVRAADMDRFTLQGTLKSGDGTLTLSGSGGVGANAPLQASIKGTNFLAADIPAANVVISPDLTIERGEHGITIGGRVEIPKTALDLAKLPGGGVSSVSPDVDVVDEQRPAADKPLPVIASVTVVLGEDIKLAGFGLNGTIGGQLKVDQHPGHAATGTGTLTVDGTYKAYGQDLTIESGRLLFTSTPLDNPGLDIRAVRKILGTSSLGSDTITAGLQVRGTALVPVLTVFSNPTMEQSQALSYLLTGKPLSALKSGEGDMLTSAAQALGSAGGNLLAKDIGARLGVDAGVSDNTAIGGAAFTVGKYLSPKLYLSYGVGLFTPGEVVTLKYLFNPRWNFEAQNATSGNRAGINYRYEH